MSLDEIGIPEQYTFGTIVMNLEAIKVRYKGILSLFSYFELHKKVECLQEIHDLFYSLDLEEWKIDRIWEYINGDIGLEVFDSILKRVKH